MPKVEIKGSGILSFPVPEAQIASIVEQAERAPYGRGEKTIVDTSVRKVWQIAPSKVRITGKSWVANFDAILSRVAGGLGCGAITVSAELYKLLVYDRRIFSPPSRYGEGGWNVRHAGAYLAVDASWRRTAYSACRP